jgi:septal ring factor EnvC (AmiA/AmiB activator)
MQAEIERLRRSEDSLKKQLEETRKQALEHKARVVQLTQLCSAADARVRDITQELQQSHESRSELGAELARLREELEAARAECQRLRDQLAQTQRSTPSQPAAATAPVAATAMSYGLVDLDRWLSAHVAARTPQPRAADTSPGVYSPFGAPGQGPPVPAWTPPTAPAAYRPGISPP